MAKGKLRAETSWDDGSLFDLKIAKLLLKHQMPGTFYISDSGSLDKPEIRHLGARFDIGGHTVSHVEDLKRLSDDELDYEVLVNKQHLEDCLRRKITKFCYPSGRYDERVIEAVKRAGYKEARTTIVLKTEGRDSFRTDTTIHTFPRREYKGRDWDEIGKEYAHAAARTGGYFHLWGHAADLERFSYWQRLRKFLQWLEDNFVIINQT